MGNTKFYNNFTIINDKLIQYTGNEKDVVIPSEVKEIGAGAFRGYEVESVTIPDGVISIGDNCFKGCSKLKRVVIPASVEKIGEDVFKGTSGVKVSAPKESYAWNFFFGKSSSGIKASDDIKKKQTSAATKTPSANTGKTAETTVTSAVHKTPDTKSKATPNIDTKITSNIDTKSTSNIDAKRVANIDTQTTSQEDATATLIQSHRLVREAYLGKRPWMVKVNLFGKADKLIRSIRTLSDQKLLIRIAREAPRADVKCAAIEYITDQAILEDFATHSISAVCATAISKITNKDFIRSIFQNDTRPEVRKAVIARLDDQSMIFDFFKNLRCNDAPELMCKLTDANLISKLAVEAQSHEIRRTAASRINDNYTYKAFLIAAAELCSPYFDALDVLAFNDAYDKLKKEYPDLLKQLSESYPHEGIRYLARGRYNKALPTGENFESRIRSITPSQSELNFRKRIEGYEYVISRVTSDFDQFKQDCLYEANRGNHSCTLESFHNNYELNRCSTFVPEYERLMKRFLSKNGFSNATLTTTPKYSANGDICGYDTVITTSW